MRPHERRRHHRALLRLPIRRITASGGAVPGAFWTSNISAGGMYFRAGASTAEVLAVGTEVSFELSVPRGGGYSASGGCVRGAGRVVRAEAVEGGRAGVAVRFSRPLSIDFQDAPG